MKRNLLTFITIFLLALSLSSPVFAVAQPEKSSHFEHWAQKYIDELALEYDIDSILKGKELNGYITIEDFQKAIQLVIDQDYTGSPDSIQREAIIYEFTRLWAEMTGNNLDEIATIKMIIYIDTDKIDFKYNHAITVAYMKEIAQGKGQGLFDPKAATTYGELITLVYNTNKAIKAEDEPKIPSIWAGKLETRASYEVKDNKVVFDFELFSHYAEPKELNFSSGQQFEVTITDEAGKEVYRYSNGKFFTMALINKTINPGESFTWQDEWDMTDKDGNLLTSGNYTATIKILALYDADGNMIDESELTATLKFSLE